MLVGHGPHNGTNGKAVEVIVDKNADPQNDGGQLRTCPGLDVGLGPPTEGGGAAGLVHQADHGSQDHQEDQDAHVIGIGH